MAPMTSSGNVVYVSQLVLDRLDSTKFFGFNKSNEPQKMILEFAYDDTEPWILVCVLQFSPVI